MKLRYLAAAWCLLIVGCQGEPTTLREEAEQAQENLEDARVQAAEVIADSEEEAVDIVADARVEAKEEMQDAKREAAKMISDAKEELTEKLDALGKSSTVDPRPSEDAESESP
ncbi:ATP synthase subunit B family protein [Stieleria neptunia]|nr:ATP synthase F0 subunit B [Stieleria neptunia]